MLESVDAEHARLLQQLAELKHEHKKLEKNPKDLVGHREHKKRLQKHIADLKIHKQRIRPVALSLPQAGESVSS